MIIRFHTKLKKNYFIIHELQKIYGVGNASIKKILLSYGLKKNLKISDLFVRKIKFEFFFNLRNIGIYQRFKIKQSIKNLISLRAYRGYRHRFGLSVRGQRTHSNNQTKRKLYYQRFK